MVFLSVPLFNQPLGCLTWSTSPAIPLLYHFFDELLGHGHSVPTLHCLHRYAQNLPGLMAILVANLADTVMGAINIYYSSVNIYYPPVVVRIDTTYYSVCLSLNVLLTLMIITRLVLHKRDIRHATGTSDGTTKLYTTVIMMLVESYALYAIAFILYIISFTLDASVAAVFSQVLSGIQVCATRARPDMS